MMIKVQAGLTNELAATNSVFSMSLSIEVISV